MVWWYVHGSFGFLPAAESCKIRSTSEREAGPPKAVGEKRLEISHPLKRGFEGLKVFEEDK
ncbi:unnamed protein product [Fusarium graminearum]|nr:unnamed protein product [Fusarium graminearum]CAG1964192.1 unnamed protein product [Fusarium graminearum]VTO84786.1 unnamed protein product [Fusarium graminearum]